MDVCLALSMLGKDWGLGSAIVEHTPEEWAAARWFDTRTKPTWEELQAAWEVYQAKNAPVDLPLGEVDFIISHMPTVGWLLLNQMGIE